MPQDAFTLKYVIKELGERLKGGKVSRINQPEKDELTFFIYTANGTVKLEICAHAQNCRLNIGENEKKPPKEAMAFCMLLRKHLQNAEVLGVTQPGFERIAAIEFDCKSDFERARRTLYCEIMGKYSNVILVQDGRILGAMKTATLESGAKRILFTGAAYRLPDPQDKADPTDLAALEEVFGGSEAGADMIALRVKGMSYSTAADIEETFGGHAFAKDVYDYAAGKFFRPCVTYRDGSPDDFKIYCPDERRCKVFASVLDAQSAYYSFLLKKKAFDDKKRRLEHALRSAEKKCEKRLGMILSRLEETRDIEDVKLKGELITANIYAIERGAKQFKAVNYYDENMPEVTIALDERLTPAQNAQKYYKRYAKLKRTLTALDVQKRDTEGERAYLESIRCAIERADDIRDFEEAETELAALGLIRAENAPKGKKQEERAPFRKYIFEGFTIIAGRNNMQNERLTKSLSERDIWLHTQKYHSSHVGILSDGREVPESVIKVAAEICAYYSEAREGSKVPVDYAFKKSVKKPSGAKPGFVTYTDYKTALAVPQKHEELACVQ